MSSQRRLKTQPWPFTVVYQCLPHPFIWGRRILGNWLSDERLMSLVWLQFQLLDPSANMVVSIQFRADRYVISRKVFKLHHPSFPEDPFTKGVLSPFITPQVVHDPTSFLDRPVLQLNQRLSAQPIAPDHYTDINGPDSKQGTCLCMFPPRAIEK